MDIGESYKKLVLSKGFRVDAHSQYCKKYRETHDDCIGCESEKGCKTYTQVMLLSMQHLAYKPRDYQDFLNMQKDVVDKIIRALDGEDVICK